MSIDRNKALRDMRRGLPVSLAISISDALKFLDCGKVEDARQKLEDALRYASAVSPGVMEHVGLDEVRPGKGFGEK